LKKTFIKRLKKVGTNAKGQCLAINAVKLLLLSLILEKIVMTKMSARSYKAHRKYIGLTQESLANRLGVSRETITRRESGSLKINEESALAILQIVFAKTNDTA